MPLCPSRIRNRGNRNVPFPHFYHCGRPNEKACDSENPGRMQISLERVPDLAPVASRSVIDRAGFSEGHLIVAPREGRGDMVLPWRIRPLVNFHQ